MNTDKTANQTVLVKYIIYNYSHKSFHTALPVFPSCARCEKNCFIQIPCKEKKRKMAGALIGEAFISASIQVICDRIASPDFIDLFRHKKLDQPLLMKLKRTLLTLNAVLDDAEEKQIEKPAVREWLDDLKHAVFDAEDLLDEINYEALRCKLEGEAQTADKLTKKVRYLLSTSRHKFYQSMNAKIQELLERLEDFVQLKGALGLREDVGERFHKELQQLPWFMNLVSMVEMKSKKISQKCCYLMMQARMMCLSSPLLEWVGLARQPLLECFTTTIR